MMLSSYSVTERERMRIKEETAVGIIINIKPWSLIKYIETSTFKSKMVLLKIYGI